MKLHDVVDEFKQKGFDAAIEGGGACPPYVVIYLKNGNVVAYIDYAGVWGGQIYDSRSVFNMGGDPNHYFEVNAKTEDSAGDVVKAFLTEVLIKVTSTN